MKPIGSVEDGTQVTQKGEVEIRAGGQTVAKGGTGGMSTEFMFRNASTINDDVIIRAGENAAIAGPISVGAETLTYTVTVGSLNGSNIYLVDGINNPRLRMIQGSTYTFNQTASTNDGHPLSFKDTSGSAYTTGVTYKLNGSSATQSDYTNTTNFNAGRSSGERSITFVVPGGAPSNLRYYCTVHGNDMGNLIDIEASAGSLAVHGTLVIV